MPKETGEHLSGLALALPFGDPGSMTVTWITWVPTCSEVQFGLQPSGPLPLHAQGSFVPFVDGVYCFGNAQGWSCQFHFRALKNGAHWSPHLAVFGDLGADNLKTFPWLHRDTQWGMYNTVLHDHGGDSGGASASLKGQGMGLATEAVSVVNQPAHVKISTLALFWDLGPAHIISFSIKVYFFLHYGHHVVQRQFHWLESDLQKANRNRAAWPWVITMGHRPMYCSNADMDDSTRHESKGFEEQLMPFAVFPRSWNAIHVKEYGHTWLHILNGTYTGVGLPGQ
ncbi:hypothetical protein P7K49_002288 [Saguinus oedipus]|uniref:Purple acid phosphatase n=1 Tax=Saguinus oedipus TaxID=9490 RepID=A0ABQ9WGY4_SAGOE|nr:hypothetical protein P7K49_002288 [Saguinus oedipus]